MKTGSLLSGAIAMVAALTASAATRAEDGRAALQSACWPAASLVARPGENIPVRLQRPGSVRMPDVGAAQQSAILSGKPIGVVRRVSLPPGKKLIALTFDLCETAGETAGYDGRIVDYLRSERIKATYFAGGQWMVSHKTRAAQLMSDPLFEVGTHGWVHRNARLIRGAELMREVAAPGAAYSALRSDLSQAQCARPHALAFSEIPAAPTLFRFPFGACDPTSLQAVSNAGLIAIQWDVSTGDPSPHQSARAIADAMIRNARPGSIIIMHANGRGYHTAEALPMAIPALRAKGFEFVTVSELMAAGKPVFAETCYDAHPGDTDRYDFFSLPRPTAASTSTPKPSHAPAPPPISQ